MIPQWKTFQNLWVLYINNKKQNDVTKFKHLIESDTLWPLILALIDKVHIYGKEVQQVLSVTESVLEGETPVHAWSCQSWTWTSQISWMNNVVTFVFVGLENDHAYVCMYVKGRPCGIAHGKGQPTGPRGEAVSYTHLTLPTTPYV